MAEKVTIMELKVDLQCSRCYKKVKKVLSKFPQIRDQMYDKEANTVTITVVCCSPEKIRDKIRCKGGESIKSIEIKPPSKPKEPEKKPEKHKEPEKKPDKPKEHEKKDDKPKEPEKKEKPKDPEDKIKQPEKKSEPKEPAGSPPAVAYPPIGFCCTECYHGHGGGPCYFGGAPQPSHPCYGRPVYDSWGCGGGYQYYYACEENPQACPIM